jgi:hypothetical protein
MSRTYRKNPNWLDRYVGRMKALATQEVAVGFPAGKGLGEPYYDTGASVLEVAIWNNYGTRRIPARPFFDNASIRMQRGFRRLAHDSFKQYGRGEKTAHQVFNEWGVWGKNMVQDEISSTYNPPNAPMTVLRKGSAHPLIDTGHMIQSVTYAVRKKSA